MKKPRDYADLLDTGRWFRAIPAPFRDALFDAALLRRLGPGELLFGRGDPPCGIYAVLDGAVRISGVSESGKEALLTLAEPPSWFGEIAVFDRLARTHDAIAEGETLLFHVPEPALEAILEREPRWWRELALLVTVKLRLALIAMEDMTVLPASVRLARRLVMMVEGYGERFEGRKRVVSVRQEQLGMMLSISRQTANQLLKDLEAQKLIALTYGEIEVLDLPGLKRVAQLSSG
jgi:CRP-like cAMP-binding protein